MRIQPLAHLPRFRGFDVVPLTEIIVSQDAPEAVVDAFKRTGVLVRQIPTQWLWLQDPQLFWEDTKSGFEEVVVPFQANKSSISAYAGKAQKVALRKLSSLFKQTNHPLVLMP